MIEVKKTRQRGTPCSRAGGNVAEGSTPPKFLSEFKVKGPQFVALAVPLGEHTEKY